jgi:hypothetical protein
MFDHDNEAFAALVKIIDPGAYDVWVLGDLDPGSTSDKRWKAAKEKADAVLKAIQSAVAKTVGPLPSGHRRCPFCGDEPSLCDPTYNGPADCWDTYIECTGCDARSPGIGREHGDDEAWAVEEAWLQWDRRVVEDSRLRSSTSETFIKALNAVVDDVELATRLWAAVLAVAGTKPVGWTQPGEIERTLSGEEDVVAQFWSRRDMAETRSLLEEVVDHKIPDDVPLYAAPVDMIFSEQSPPEVIDLTWSIGGEGHTQTHHLETIIGKYAAWTKNDEAHVIVPGALRSQVVGQAIEDALEFAQKHFASQILAQLKP